MHEDLENDPIYMAAAEWIVRLQQPSLSLDETIEWQQWKNADPRHARAFESIEELWNKMEGVGRSPIYDAQAADDYDGREPLSMWLARQDTAARALHIAPSSKAIRVVWAVAAVVLLVIGTAVVQMLMIDTRATSFETPIGGRKTVALADGSILELAGHSRCEVRLDRKQRIVTLVRGEVLFHVAKDAHRPFRVRADNTNVEAVGTEFDVHRNTDRIVVSVVEGRVRVQRVESLVRTPWVNWTYANGEPMTLGAGDQTTVNQTGIESRGTLSDTEATLSWRHGRLAFERERLRDVIEDVNRYSATPIVLDDPQMGDILITGTVSESDIEGWAASLESAIGLHAERQRERILLKHSVPR